MNQTTLMNDVLFWNLSFFTLPNVYNLVWRLKKWCNNNVEISCIMYKKNQHKHINNVYDVVYYVTSWGTILNTFCTELSDQAIDSHDWTGNKAMWMLGKFYYCKMCLLSFLIKSWRRSSGKKQHRTNISCARRNISTSGYYVQRVETWEHCVVGNVPKTTIELFLFEKSFKA